MTATRRLGWALLTWTATWVAGCGGCQQESAPKPAAAPQAAAPAAAATKPAAAKPTLPPPGPTNTLPADALTPPPEDPEAALAEDCFVMMDAFPDYGAPPLKVKFSSEVECNSGAPKFKWDFGDGSAPSTEANPTHTYEKEGEFVASVTVTGPSGGTDSDELDIVVEKESSKKDDADSED